VIITTVGKTNTNVVIQLDPDRQYSSKYGKTRALGAGKYQFTCEYMDCDILEEIPPLKFKTDTTTPVLKTKLTASSSSGNPIYYNTVSADYEGKWTLYTKAIPIVNNGSFYFKSTNASGQEITNAITFSNFYDRPEITLAANSETPTRQTTLTATTDSGLALYYANAYAGPWKPYTGPLSITENGAYYFKTAEDEFGQKGEAFIQFKNIDGTPPVLYLAGNTRRKAASATLTASSEATASIEYNTVAADYDGEWTAYTEAIEVTANGTYFFRATDQAGNSTVKAIVFENIAAPKAATRSTRAAAPQIVMAEENVDGNIILGKAKGVWQSGYQATHVGTLGDEWEGTRETVSLKGKNKILDIYTGMGTATVLALTDDANGDALFLDDIFSALPEELDEPLARIAGITEILAGDGDDVVDMTSKEFPYIGEGMTIRGGDGNDTIWANKGSNVLCGDAGDDRLVGASGNDVLDGGTGNDSIHGGGGADIVRLCADWGHDTVEQLPGGTIILQFPAGTKGTWDPDTMTFTSEDGKNSVILIGIDADNVAILFDEEEDD
jgi:Ca2+-binding RTX toxin-like protein